MRSQEGRELVKAEQYGVFCQDYNSAVLATGNSKIITAFLATGNSKIITAGLASGNSKTQIVWSTFLEDSEVDILEVIWLELDRDKRLCRKLISSVSFRNRSFPNFQRESEGACSL